MSYTCNITLSIEINLLSQASFLESCYLYDIYKDNECTFVNMYVTHARCRKIFAAGLVWSLSHLWNFKTSIMIVLWHIMWTCSIILFTCNLKVMCNAHHILRNQQYKVYSGNEKRDWTLLKFKKGISYIYYHQFLVSSRHFKYL